MRLGRRQSPHSTATPPPSSTWPAPLRSAAPTLWWRWPPGPAPHRLAAGAPPRCSPWSSGSRCSKAPILELFNRTMVTPGTAARWLTEAYVERVVFDSPTVLDIGAQRRFFTGALRRAIEIRDRTCFHPSCDEVPQRPEIDHIHDAANGGPTTQINGQHGCSFPQPMEEQPHPDPDNDDDPDDDPG